MNDAIDAAMMEFGEMRAAFALRKLRCTVALHCHWSRKRAAAKPQLDELEELPLGMHPERGCQPPPLCPPCRTGSDPHRGH